MSSIFDFVWETYHFVLLGILLIVFFSLLSVFIKNKKVLVILIIAIVLGTMFVIHQSRNTTFHELFPESLNKKSDIMEISIEVNDLTGKNLEPMERITIETESTINEIMEDLKIIEVRKTENASVEKRFTLYITVRNKVSEDHLSTTTVQIDIDEAYLNEYEIISEGDHLRKIKSVLGNAFDS